MSAETERRQLERKRIETPMIYGGEDRNIYHDAMMYNCSVTGIYFESSRGLSSGTEICIRLKIKPSLSVTEPYERFYGQVKWCREISNAGAERFGIGVQCYDPFIH